jgi:hypothetical protein
MHSLIERSSFSDVRVSITNLKDLNYFLENDLLTLVIANQDMTQRHLFKNILVMCPRERYL